MASLVVIGIAISLVQSHGTAPDRSPALWQYLLILCLGAVITPVVSRIGYRTDALSPALDAEAARSQATARFQQLMILRFALCESVAIVSIALAFASRPPAITVYLLGAVISLLLMAVHVWPSQRVVDQVQQRLDRDGGRSELAAVLNGEASGSGAS